MANDSRDNTPGKTSRDVINLDDVRRRVEEEKEDAVAPIRLAFMEELGDMLDEYLDAVDAATGGDTDKAVEELMAACASVLALAAEEHFDGLDDQIEFIDAVAEIATDLVTDEDEQDELSADEEEDDDDADNDDRR